MFRNESHRIESNQPRLSYGVAACDIDGDGRPEFVVTGFGTRNLVLDWKTDGKIRDTAPDSLADPGRRAIGIAAADANRDGEEEIYILNTDTFMGMKRFGDRFFSRNGAHDTDPWIDLFDLPMNIENPNLTAGRSVAAIDTDGSGVYRMLTANYGGPMRIHELAENNRVRDLAGDLGIRSSSGGRSLAILPDLGPYPAVFCGNENDANSLFVRGAGAQYFDQADGRGLADPAEHARGVALCDIDGDGLLDLVVANWNGPHRLFIRRSPGDPESAFSDRASARFAEPSPNRNVIAADFDNDGRTEIFMNNIGRPNRLFRVGESSVVELDIEAAAEPDELGTGASVADIDGDGILELLVVHGESGEQPLSMFKARRAAEHNYLRVLPLTPFGAPARGAVVRLEVGNEVQVRCVDSGSGYLCQMEPAAHFGLGRHGSVDAIEIRWPGGAVRRVENPGINHEIEVTP